MYVEGFGGGGGYFGRDEDPHEELKFYQKLAMIAAAGIIAVGCIEGARDFAEGLFYTYTLGLNNSIFIISTNSLER